MLTAGWYTFFGWLFFLTTLPSVILHIIVLLAIFKISTFNQRIAVRLLFSMCIADASQTLLHLISAIVTIRRIDLSYRVNITLGLLIETFWEAMMFLQLGLGIDRLYIVSKNTIIIESEFKWFDWPVLLSWLASFIYTLLYWIGGRRLHYDFEFLGWPTEYSNTTISNVTQTDIVLYLYNGETAFMCIGFILCLLVVTVMGYRRRHNSASQMMSMSNSSMEFRMLTQISLIYILSISNIILWNIFSTAPVEYQALLNFEWILICALPPYLNILVSGEIRRAVLQLLMPGYKKILKMAPLSITRKISKQVNSTAVIPTTTNVTTIPSQIIRRKSTIPQININTISDTIGDVNKPALENSRRVMFVSAISMP